MCLQGEGSKLLKAGTAFDAVWIAPRTVPHTQASYDTPRCVAARNAATRSTAGRRGTGTIFESTPTRTAPSSGPPEVSAAAAGTGTRDDRARNLTRPADTSRATNAKFHIAASRNNAPDATPASTAAAST